VPITTSSDQQREDQQHGRRVSIRDEHARRIDGVAGAAGVILRDRLAQLRQATAVGVARLAVAQRAGAGQDRGRGRRPIRLADLEMDHVSAVTLHGKGALHHLHRQERLDGEGALREMQRHATRVAARR
jgi:hypothetical protein